MSERKECMNCNNKVENVGGHIDPFCSNCEPLCHIDDHGRVRYYNKVKLSLFYRDASNYKDSFTEIITVKKLLEVIPANELGESLDPTHQSDPLFEIESFGLDTSDIPMVAEYGLGDDDHNYISITKIEGIE